MTVSQILYGTLPKLGTMILFIFLLGIFTIGAPRVPGGTVMASLSLITSVLNFNDAGTIALMLTGITKKLKINSKFIAGVVLF